MENEYLLSLDFYKSTHVLEILPLPPRYEEGKQGGWLFTICNKDNMNERFDFENDAENFAIQFGVEYEKFKDFVREDTIEKLHFFRDPDGRPNKNIDIEWNWNEKNEEWQVSISLSVGNNNVYSYISMYEAEAIIDAMEASIYYVLGW